MEHFCLHWCGLHESLTHYKWLHTLNVELWYSDAAMIDCGTTWHLVLVLIQTFVKFFLLFLLLLLLKTNVCPHICSIHLIRAFSQTTIISSLVVTAKQLHETNKKKDKTVLLSGGTFAIKPTIATTELVFY